MENKEYKIEELIFSHGGVGHFNIDPEWLQRLKGSTKDFKQLAEIQSKAADPRAVNLISLDSSGKSSDMIGILDMKGVLLYSGAEWLEYFGFTSYELFSSRFDALMADERVKTVLLRIQSPGGTAFGASELSQKVYDARSSKKIVAYADPYAFSAAYEIGSAAESFYTTKSGMVGSIGSYSMHYDLSEYYKEMGVSVTFIKAGEKKVDGNQFEPLSASAKKDIQEEIDRFYEVFVADVARNRGVDENFVKENFGKGGRVMAIEALQVGMIDGILSIEDLINQELSSLSNEKNLAQNRAFIKNNLAFLDLEE